MIRTDLVLRLLLILRASESAIYEPLIIEIMIQR